MPTPLATRVWYLRHAPLDKVKLHWTLDLHRYDGEEFFEHLVKDIAQHGMDNPLLVHNFRDGGNDLSPTRVVHGCTRYRALVRLGWKTAPILLCGEPLGTMRGAIELHSVEEAQSYITDGQFTNTDRGPRILDCHWAQTMQYNRSVKPYFPSEADEK